MTMDNSLKEIRKAIDAIDEQLLSLFLKRMQYSAKVAEIKIAAGLPVLNRRREAEIIADVEKKAGQLGWAAAALYTSIMAVSRGYQESLMGAGKPLEVLAAAAQGDPPEAGARVMCQGVEGAYSHQAARVAFRDADVRFCPRFDGVFAALEKGDADFGVVPVENSAAGSVAEVYGLILQHRYYIVKAVRLSVSHCIAARPGDQVKTVLSHPQALMQCKCYLDEKGYERREFSNTAAAARYIAESGEAGLGAICSVEAAKQYGLSILEENIQDDKNNHTRFAVVSREPIFPKNAEKISLCFSMPNETGALYRVLESFALSGLSLTKIESRPIRGKNFEYDFYLDFAGSLKDRGVTDLLARLENELTRFSFLGNYHEVME